MWELLKTLYEVFGASNPRASVVLAALLGAVLFGGSWWLLGKQYEKSQRGPSPLANGVAVEEASPLVSDDQTPGASRHRAAEEGVLIPRRSQPLSRDPGDKLRERLAAMYGSAMKLSLSVERVPALEKVINAGLNAGRPDLVASYVGDLSLSIERAYHYKGVLDALIRVGQLGMAQALVENLSLSVERDSYHRKIIDAAGQD